MRVDDDVKLGGHGPGETGKLLFDPSGRTNALSACTSESCKYLVMMHDGSLVVTTVYMEWGEAVRCESISKDR